MVFLVPEDSTRVLGRQLGHPDGRRAPGRRAQVDQLRARPGRRRQGDELPPVPGAGEGIQGVDPTLAKDPIINIPSDKIDRLRDAARRRPRARSSATAPTRSSRPPDHGGRRGQRRARPPAAGASWAPRPGCCLLALAVGLYTQLGTLGLGLAPAVALLAGHAAAVRGRRRSRSGASARTPAGERAAYPLRRSRSRRSRTTARSSSSRSASCCCSRSPRTVGFGEVQYGFDLGNFSAALDPLYIDVFLRTLRTRGDRHGADRSSSATRSPTGSRATRRRTAAACSWR